MKIKLITFLFICSLVTFTSCGDEENGFEITDEVTDPDDIDFEEEINVTIVFSSLSATITGQSSDMRIRQEGADIEIETTRKGVKYSLAGETNNGSLKIISSENCKLLPDGVKISNDKIPAINIVTEGTAYIALNSQTTSMLSDGEEPSADEMKACLTSTGALDFYGEGQLTITGNAKHGISCNKHIIVRKDCNIRILNAEADGIHTTDYIIIDGGIIDVTAVNEGFESKQSNIAINSGNIKILTTGDKSDGLKCPGNIRIKEGTIAITTKGKASKAIKCNSNQGDVIIEGGKITLLTEGDAMLDDDGADTSSSQGINSQGNVIISNKETELTITSTGTGGKGISCDKNLTIEEGTVIISATGNRFVADNGLTSSAKGIRCEGNIIFNGGTVNSYSETSDGIDSKSKITINGGTITSSGAETEESFNCEKKSFFINGGTVTGTGGSTNSPVSSSNQRSLLFETVWEKDKTIAVKTADGATILASKISRSYEPFTLLFSSPELVPGRYEIYCDDTRIKEFTVTSTLTKI